MVLDEHVFKIMLQTNVPDGVNWEPKVTMDAGHSGCSVAGTTLVLMYYEIECDRYHAYWSTLIMLIG